LKSPGKKTGVTSRRSSKSKDESKGQQLDFVFPAAPTFLVLGRDANLERQARELLAPLAAEELAGEVRVEWNARLCSAAGRADSRRNLISLNPRLREHGTDEIDRTVRHELAHLLAQFRSGRRRVAPHGREWKKACRDLGIGDEARCHALPFPVRQRTRRYLYRCERCGKEFPRVRKIKRTVACLECCRKFNRGKFDPKSRLRLVSELPP
jgi:predicted SprT family Zn-dependent metalloprotease